MAVGVDLSIVRERDRLSIGVEQRLQNTARLDDAYSGHQTINTDPTRSDSEDPVVIMHGGSLSGSAWSVKYIVAQLGHAWHTAR